MAYLYSTQFSDCTLSSAEIIEISQAISRDYQTTARNSLPPAQHWQKDELIAISLQISRDYAPNLQSPMSISASSLAPTELREIAKLISSRYSPEAYSPQTDKENLVLLPVDPDKLFIYGTLTDKNLPVFETAKPTGYLPLNALESMVNVDWGFASPTGQPNTASSVGVVSDSAIHRREICKWGFDESILKPPTVRFSQPFISWVSPKVLPSLFSSPIPAKANKHFGKSASGQNNTVLR